LTTRAIEVAKFRARYRYSFDDEYFYLLWEKGGRKLVHDRYPLNELSADLDHWRGRPHSTVSNIKYSMLWLAISIVAFILSSSPLMVLLAVFSFFISSVILFKEIGFIFPVTATVLNYEDLSGSVYMFHGRNGSEDWPAFEKELSDAIRDSKLFKT
jgi:hypothetical protein